MLFLLFLFVLNNASRLHGFLLIYFVIIYIYIYRLTRISGMGLFGCKCCVFVGCLLVVCACECCCSVFALFVSCLLCCCWVAFVCVLCLVVSVGFCSVLLRVCFCCLP